MAAVEGFIWKLDQTPRARNIRSPSSPSRLEFSSPNAPASSQCLPDKSTPTSNQLRTKAQAHCRLKCAAPCLFPNYSRQSIQPPQAQPFVSECSLKPRGLSEGALRFLQADLLLGLRASRPAQSAPCVRTALQASKRFRTKKYQVEQSLKYQVVGVSFRNSSPTFISMCYCGRRKSIRKFLYGMAHISGCRSCGSLVFEHSLALDPEWLSRLYHWHLCRIPSNGRPYEDYSFVAAGKADFALGLQPVKVFEQFFIRLL